MVASRRKMQSRNVPFAKRKRNARADTLDFRDRMFQSSLVEVPTHIDLDDYTRAYRKYHRRGKVRVLDQGEEGACTGYALASVVHFLLQTRAVDPERTAVSPEMLYATAKRFDEWRGENYDGSSARGAMKGWHKIGAASKRCWQARAGTETEAIDENCARDARTRPLGAYYRVNHKDLVAMHAALAEVGILYATSLVHTGWDAVTARKPEITYPNDIDGGHAFVIVGYNQHGFWIQNSWGEGWGKNGFALLSYDDWLENGTDVWVARLGVPIRLNEEHVATRGRAVLARRTGVYSLAELRPHILNLENDGALKSSGDFATTEDDLLNIVLEDIPRITRDWKKKRLHLYAHGGLVGEDSAIERIAEFAVPLLKNEVYPLAIVWNSDIWSTLRNILQDAFRERRSEGLLDRGKEFFRDRIDDSLEPLARFVGGKAFWAEMKENALAATRDQRGGLRLFLDHLDAHQPDLELHCTGHSAGSIVLAPVVQRSHVATCTLWAPACSIQLFKQTYLPALAARHLKRFNLFTLSDEAERDDDCVGIYHKSLLYLVSNAFEDKPRLPFMRDGEPLLGMAKFVEQDRELKALFRKRYADWVVAPIQTSKRSLKNSTALHHVDFDEDRPTLASSLGRIIGRYPEGVT